MRSARTSEEVGPLAYQLGAMVGRQLPLFSLIAAIVSGFLMGFSPGKMIAEYGRTIRLCAISLITISAMLAIGTLTPLSGVDATLGLAFAATGVLYPFFGTLLGWLGAALTGSDTSSNILFGNLQKITSEPLGLSPILMGAANSSGGVIDKMIDAQSIVVASTATRCYGHEGSILRHVFLHSIVLACLVGVLVTLQAYVYPFTAMVVKQVAGADGSDQDPRSTAADLLSGRQNVRPDWPMLCAFIRTTLVWGAATFREAL